MDDNGSAKRQGVADNADTATSRPPGKASTRLWCGLAGVCVGVGAVGAVLPLLPTTPFLLLAAFAASKGSPRLHRWLYTHPRYGPLLVDWREHRALRPRTKITALLLLIASWLLLLYTIDSLLVRSVASAMMLAVAAFLVTRPHGPRY